MFLITIISMIIGLSISFFLARRYDMSEKVDKGIGFCYWKLSYRRKLIRTLWMVPVLIIINIAFYKEFPAYSYARIIGVILFCRFLSRLPTIIRSGKTKLLKKRMEKIKKYDILTIAERKFQQGRGKVISDGKTKYL